MLVSGSLGFMLHLASSAQALARRPQAARGSSGGLWSAVSAATMRLLQKQVVSIALARQQVWEEPPENGSTAQEGIDLWRVALHAATALSDAR